MGFEEEEESRGVVERLNNLIIETVGTEEEAEELLKESLGMKVEETGEGTGWEGS